jgi:hypothetical protein
MFPNVFGKYVLFRGDQELFIRGMIHVASGHIYQILQAELDDAHKQGYKILFEGINMNLDNVQMTPAEKQVAEFLIALMDLYPSLSRGHGKTVQSKKIKYPEGSERVDATLYEIVLEARSRDIFFPSGLVDLMKDDFYQEILSSQDQDKYRDSPKAKRFAGQLTGQAAHKRLNELLAVLLGWRNEMVVFKINEYFSHHKKGKIYMHYGNKHLSGILDLLIDQGWYLYEETALEDEL